MITLFPAEWQPQDAILLAWPHQNTDWAPWLVDVQQVYLALAATISQYQKLVITCDPVLAQDEIRQQLIKAKANLTNIVLATIATNDTWARDHGAICVIKEGEVTSLDFQFNAWGGKFEANLDNQITAKLVTAGILKKAQKVDLVLEGGSIETDGHGSLLTTEICLLNDNRNQALSKAELELALSKHLGIKRFLWLTQGHLPGDDTDAHIDTLARFCDPHTIAYVQCTDKNHPLFAQLKAMEDELKSFRDYQGQVYKLVALPLCDEIHNQAGDLLPATYANFLITNQQVLVPVYGLPQDQLAIDILTNTFCHTLEKRQVKAINCRALIEQYGSLHCITMQLAQGALAN